MTSTKTNPGNYFEDFKFGQVIVHPTPRTVTVGDVALYTSLYGTRFAVQSSDAFAKAIGYPISPLDDLLTFHMVFGKTTPEISLNAIANLGYASCRFLKPVYPGDTLASTSEVIGLKENSNRETGTAAPRSLGSTRCGRLGTIASGLSASLSRFLTITQRTYSSTTSPFWLRPVERT